ncbi:DMT family transporter [Vibrio gazogenes]|uniref:Permease of the drug/metabolite transporter (DMT) superfamily n=1 Tax=Vibrio gazogenes DSM 21264 = NBRC 103151 TaxID=1123492 RepID=A0A1M4WZ53_VIBGA|nr:DMT family transporter [Vibrio gazogenes]USP13073.1 DMT family transporter [Vibrio gazogenes]SHE86541.1 Permease of the drug/metabolite transporter (DMT) superfamily [Vibrio gazogenes DSM 21264] [Vibrio gazogenes DSM 21264 = NBRC 103151]SJN58924.1 putative DMT superfamily transporter inner membrane protein [Vibrio gazogenes]
MKSNSIIKAVVLLIICTFFWGSSFPVGKHALGEVHALTLVFWRFIIAASCLAVYLKVKRMPAMHLSVFQWSWVISVSIIGVGGLNLGLFTGLATTNATNGSLIMALSPLMTSLIASVAQRTLPSFVQCLSLLVSLAGVLMVLTNGHFDTLLSMQINHGDQLIFGGMFAWSLYTYFSQGISRWMPMIPYTFIGMLSGASVIGIMCLISPEVSPFTELWKSSALGISEIVYIGVFGTVAGYLLWLNGVRQLGSADAALFFNFVPIFSVLTSFMFGQAVTQLQLLGIVIVITGLLLPRIRLLKRGSKPCSEF